MRSVQRFLGETNEFLSQNFRSMRHRISAAILPYTCRNHSRKHDRIPTLNRNDCMPIFWTGMTCGMSRKKRLPQAFLITFLNQDIA